MAWFSEGQNGQHFYFYSRLVLSKIYFIIFWSNQYHLLLLVHIPPTPFFFASFLAIPSSSFCWSAASSSFRACFFLLLLLKCLRLKLIRLWIGRDMTNKYISIPTDRSQKWLTKNCKPIIQYCIEIYKIYLEFCNSSEFSQSSEIE